MKIQHILFATFALFWIGTASPDPNGHDLEYMGSKQHLDGSSTVQTIGPALRHDFNNKQYQEGMAHFSRQELVEAEKSFRSIVKNTPDEIAALQGLATTLFEQRRYQEAGDTFQAILKQDPHFYLARAGLGAVYRVLGRYPEAAEEYSLALGENPSLAVAYYGRGVSNFEMGKRTEAHSDLNEVQQLLPPTAELAIQAKTYLDKIQSNGE